MLFCKKDRGLDPQDPLSCVPAFPSIFLMFCSRTMSDFPNKFLHQSWLLTDRFILQCLILATCFQTAFTRCRNNLKTVRDLTVRNSLQDFEAIERYLHPKASKTVLFSKFSSFYDAVSKMCRLEFSFQNLPFSKCAGKKVPAKKCRQKSAVFV